MSKKDKEQKHFENNNMKKEENCCGKCHENDKHECHCHEKRKQQVTAQSPSSPKELHQSPPNYICYSSSS